MPGSAHLTFLLPTEAETAALGRTLGGALGPGDTLLLHGPIGAGKTHLARALIQARLGRAEDVPSPTFTLVQVYDTPGAEVWHADLYRLGHPDEIVELGLDAAFEKAICLIEWPDRLGQALPAEALHLHLDHAGEGRRARLIASPRHHPLLARIVAHGANVGKGFPTLTAGA